MQEIREWIDKGIEPVPISVNISREYIHTFDVVGEMLHLVNKYDIPIKLLELEITETTDSEGVSDVVQKMKDAGFTMLMDDFGSGYSSLNMLQKTQFDVLKIDRGFFRNSWSPAADGRLSRTRSQCRVISVSISSRRAWKLRSRLRS